MKAAWVSKNNVRMLECLNVRMFECDAWNIIMLRLNKA